jgi:hypothetical protein
MNVHGGRRASRSVRTSSCSSGPDSQRQSIDSSSVRPSAPKFPTVFLRFLDEIHAVRSSLALEKVILLATTQWDIQCDLVALYCYDLDFFAKMLYCGAHAFIYTYCLSRLLIAAYVRCLRAFLSCQGCECARLMLPWSSPTGLCQH